MSGEVPEPLPQWSYQPEVGAECTPGSSREISQRERLLTRYFRTPPNPPDHSQAVRLMTLGAAIAAVGLALGVAMGFSACLPAIAILAGAGSLAGKGALQMLRDKYTHQKSLVRLFPQPSDREVDRWLSETLDRVAGHSLEAVDLTPEECQMAGFAPIVGPILWHVHGVAVEDLVWKVGQDGLARFGVYRVSYLWLGQDHLAIFACDYDFIRDAMLNEETLEFFYRDIISVSIHKLSSALTLPSGKSLTTHQELRISVSNDRYFSMTVGSEELREVTGAERVPDPGTESALRALRSKLRERKAPPSAV